MSADTDPNEREIRIPIKEATARNFLMLNAGIEQAQHELTLRERRVQDSLRTILTEHDVATGSRVVRVTQEPPYELVVMVPIASEPAA